MEEIKAAYRSGVESEGAAGSIPQSAGLRILEAAYSRDGEGAVHFSVDNDLYKNDVGKSREYPKGSVIFIGGREVDLSKCHAVGVNGSKLNKDTFLMTPAGNLNWYEFPTDKHTQSMLKKKGIVPKPVRLRVGWQKERTDGGFGLLHILKHYNTFLDMIPPESPLLHLFRSVTGKLNIKSKSFSRKEMLSVNNGKAGELVLELTDDGECYSIVTCYPTRHPMGGEGNGIAIKGAYLQFLSGRKTPSLNTGNQASESTPESVGVTGRLLSTNVARDGVAGYEVHSISNTQVSHAGASVLLRAAFMQHGGRFSAPVRSKKCNIPVVALRNEFGSWSYMDALLCPFGK